MTVVCLDGEHDIATLPFLTDTLATAIFADDTDVVIDLSGVTFISAATHRRVDPQSEHAARPVPQPDPPVPL